MLCYHFVVAIHQLLVVKLIAIVPGTCLLVDTALSPLIIITVDGVLCLVDGHYCVAFAVATRPLKCALFMCGDFLVLHLWHL